MSFLPVDISIDEIRALDAAHVWHPYTGFPAAHAPLVVESASGVRLRLADGRELIDGMSSWWAAIHGYRNPVLDAAATDQLARMSHVMFGGLTHRPAVELAKLLVEITPVGLDRVFLCDSGSVSVEVAVKMSLQYWRALGRPEKSRLLTWRGGYHGDTFTPMSVCDPETGMHSLWSDVLRPQVFVGVPPTQYSEDYAAQLITSIGEHAHELAAVIVEPIVQGAGGMRFHDPEYLRVLRRACDDHSVLLIFDEIATGFGRTGTLFAADRAAVSPDVMCVGKALTGGYVSLAAALCTSEIAARITEAHGALMHGPTFMGNPFACAIAVASIGLLQTQQWHTKVGEIEAQLRRGLAPAAQLSAVADVRVLGAIGVIELKVDVDVAAATEVAVAHGVWLRPFRNLIYCMPPYICTPEDVASISAAMVEAARSAHS